jgi:hypothetical protein
MDIIAVWLIDYVFFSAGLCYLLYVSHKAYFIVLSPRLSVTRTICLHFHFLVSRPRSTVNTDNAIEEEIKERIALGNKASCANKKILIVIVVLPCMLTITRLLVQQNAHFYY